LKQKRTYDNSPKPGALNTKFSSRDEYIRAVAKAIDELGPNKVNLKNPQVVVSVQVLRTMCGIAASYNFTKLKR
jgi:tRNA(Ser,Leu) C12 N-acetylase TAN1